ncbi:hypothetical protein CAS74_004500 [Pichia kudriavzevii]|uniref:Uncharacterized protein n=1 Tax=Pichia kudriavzevii TaxID=4909 RepID=A0A1Z8JI45_PICKU|nr:hypothetical protein CAS74_004500 [Pichia kudriavzevii]
MTNSKYDIPYAMTPVKNGKKGKGKKSKYSAYLEDQDSWYNRMLSPNARKLLPLKNHKKAEMKGYDMELEYSNSREANLISDEVDNFHDANHEELDVDEIDIFDSDEGEIASPPRKSIKKANEDAKRGDSSFDEELDELVETGNKKLKGENARNVKGQLANKEMENAREKARADAAAKAKAVAKAKAKANANPKGKAKARA